MVDLLRRFARGERRARRRRALGRAAHDSDCGRVAEQLTELYGFPVSRRAKRVASGSGASYTAAADCASVAEDLYATAAAELAAYRADVARSSRSPGAVADAELRRRLRAIRRQLVTSLQLGNTDASLMLAAMHREFAADGDEIAAAVWDEVRAKLHDAGPASELADASSGATTGGIDVSVLADQSIMMFELDRPRSTASAASGRYGIRHS